MAVVFGLHAAAILALVHRLPTELAQVSSEAVLLDLAPEPDAAPPAAEVKPQTREVPQPEPVMEPSAPPEAPPEPAPPEPLPEPMVAPAEAMLPLPPPLPMPRPVPRSPPRQATEAPRAAAPSSAPAVAAPVPAPTLAPPSSAVPTWQGQLLGRLQRFKRYPELARARREEGVAYVTFAMSRSGQVLSTAIARSSGSPALDAETLALLRRAEPLPPPPPEMPGDPVTLTVPVRFSLQP